MHRTFASSSFSFNHGPISVFLVSWLLSNVEIGAVTSSGLFDKVELVSRCFSSSWIAKAILC